MCVCVGGGGSKAFYSEFIPTIDVVISVRKKSPLTTNRAMKLSHKTTFPFRIDLKPEAGKYNFKFKFKR